MYDESPRYSTSLDAKLPGEALVELHHFETGWVAYQEAVDCESICSERALTEAGARRAARLRAMAAGVVDPPETDEQREWREFWETMPNDEY